MLGIALSILGFPLIAGGQPDNDELRRLIDLQAEQIQRQSEQIQVLSRRLAILEGKPDAIADESGLSSPRSERVPVDVDAGIPAMVQAEVAETGAGARADWSGGGPTFRDGETGYSFRPRLRILADVSGTRGSSFDRRNIAGTHFRQLRLGMGGQIAGVDYKADVEFSGNHVSVTDAYLLFNTTAFGRPAEIYLGSKYKEIGIDGTTALSRVPLMERNAVASVTQPESGYYGLGVQARIAGDRGQLSLGVTSASLGEAGTVSDAVVYGARAHWIPLHDDYWLLHVGGWGYYETFGAESIEINAVSRLALRFNDNVRVQALPLVDADDSHAWGLETGGVWRSLWAFGEYGRREIAARDAGSQRYDAFSLAAGWLITGERPAFSSSTGEWLATRVDAPFPAQGSGAFELAARYDRYDYNASDSGSTTGESWTLGLNWYLTDWSRVMFNYVRWRTDNRIGNYLGPDRGHTLGARVQTVF